MRRGLLAAVIGLGLWSVLFGQRQLIPLPDEEDHPAVVPADAGEKTEFVFGRLRYPSYKGGNDFWRMRGNWTIDFPKADRQFVQGVRRLTRLHVRSLEEVVNMDGDQIFDYPWLYVVEPGHWDLTEAQTAKLREYLLRGGFLMTDDFHGTFEWDIFMASMNRVFPDRSVVDVDNKDEIFHSIYDLNERFQVPGIIMFRTGTTYEYDGYQATFRGIYDDQKRMMVGVCHNMDLGDAWEWADWPQYPERYASLAYRIGINYIIYSMTH